MVKQTNKARSQKLNTWFAVLVTLGIVIVANLLSEFVFYRIDLTEVEQINNQVSEINYELEVEFMNLKNDVSDKYRAHSGLLLIRDIINMCEEIGKDCKLIKPEEEEVEEEEE